MTRGAAHRVPPRLDEPSPQFVRRVRRGLLRWYDANRRDLPWRRRSRDPYAQWVAEVMLQQTRVETALRYYEPFLRRFPTLEALAAAAVDDVLKAWEGLGYYRRALSLHRAAGELAGAGLAVPRTSTGLAELPGVGDYTAAAIASIAFGEPVAAVDGNVIRVISRLFGITSDVTSGAGRALVRRRATMLLSARRPGDFNQAWMDLGSALCTPRSPACDRCPLRRHCAAFRANAVHRSPQRSAQAGRATPVVRVAACVARRGGHLLLRQRPLGGLWSGLWEFPQVELGPLDKRRRPRLTDFLDGVEASDRRPVEHIGTVTHQLTHRRYIFEIWSTECAADGSPNGFVWKSQQELDAVAMSAVHRKILRILTKSARPGAFAGTSQPRDSAVAVARAGRSARRRSRRRARSGIRRNPGS